MNHVDDDSMSPADGAVFAAEQACGGVIEYLEELHELDEDEHARLHLFGGVQHSRGTNCMAEIARKVGRHHNLPVVCATHLKIHGHIDDPALTEAEALVIATFTNVLLGIDAFDAAVEARRLAAEEEANRPAPVPVPIEDTILEPVDEMTATSGKA